MGLLIQKWRPAVLSVERLTQNFTDGWDDSKIFVEMNTSEFFRYTRKVALVVMLDGHHHYRGVGGD